MKILKTLLNVVTIIYADNDVKVKDHCHITGKYRGSAHRDCNINLKLNHKIPAAFHNLKICDSHIVIQELGNMRDYHNLYLKCDFSLLPDVLEKIRNNSLKNYGLCPSQYLSTPGLSWDAMLKITKTELELIPDPDMFTFFE